MDELPDDRELVLELVVHGQRDGIPDAETSSEALRDRDLHASLRKPCFWHSLRLQRGGIIAGTPSRVKATKGSGPTARPTDIRVGPAALWKGPRSGRSGRGAI